MASFMESVNKGITAFSMKTSNFAEVTKCKTYISTLESEIEKLKALMKVASGQLDFERAIEIRERIAELKMRLRKAGK